MSVFKPIVLSFKDKTYTLAADKVLYCIAEMEDVISLRNLSNPLDTTLAKVSLAYAIALRHAGAINVIGDDVYECAFEKGKGVEISSAVSGLLAMMIPPSKLQAGLDVKKPIAKTKNTIRKTKN